jgi:hypothetical protein
MQPSATWPELTTNLLLMPALMRERVEVTNRTFAAFAQVPTSKDVCCEVEYSRE